MSSDWRALLAAPLMEQCALLCDPFAALLVVSNRLRPRKHALPNPIIGTAHRSVVVAILCTCRLSIFQKVQFTKTLKTLMSALQSFIPCTVHLPFLNTLRVHGVNEKMLLCFLLSTLIAESHIGNIFSSGWCWQCATNVSPNLVYFIRWRRRGWWPWFLHGRNRVCEALLDGNTYDCARGLVLKRQL